MNIGQLEAFMVVTKVKSLSEAAKILHLTQPALSQQMKSLESWLGVELLRRTNRGVELTPQGEVFEEYAAGILDLYRNLKRDLANVVDEDGRRITVGAGSTIGNYALPCSIAIFREKAPDVIVTLRVSNSSSVVSGVLDGSLDLGFIEGRAEGYPKRDQLVEEKIAETEIIVAASPDTTVPEESIEEQRPGGAPASPEGRGHTGQCPAYPRVSIQSLLGMPMIVRETGSGTRNVVESVLKTMGLGLGDFKVVMELNSVDAIKSAVAAGKGVAFIPVFAVRKELYTGYLKGYKVVGAEFACPFSMIRLKDRTVQPVQQRFMSFIRSSRRGFC